MSEHEELLENNCFRSNKIDQIYEETDLCYLVENDYRCGQIFYNQTSRILKFSCVFCKNIFYNVQHYCDHLSQHINDDVSQITEDAAYKTEYIDHIENVSENEISLDENENTERREENHLNANISQDIFNESNSAEPILFQESSFEKSKVLTKKKSSNKKITTIKIIAVKNRIAELYEKIKLEEVKRSRSNFNEDLPKELIEDNQSSDIGCNNDTVQLIQKVIGETVITHIPYAIYNSKSPLIINDSIYEDVDRRTICPACGEKFRNAFSLAIHKRKHYLESSNEVKLAHKCSHCNQLFNKISEMKDHLQQIHYPQGFICKICNKKLTSLSLLESHMRKVHLNKPFNCKKCGKNFDNREIYDAHVMSHNSNDNYKCKICGRKYNSERILRLHLERHKERKPQCCVVCNKMTMRITQHMKIHTPRPLKKLTCKACGKHFNFTSGLSHHIKKWHQNCNEISIDKEINLNENGQDIGKGVIVELIESATDNSSNELYSNSFETTPPIAREETISAVNSIVNY